MTVSVSPCVRLSRALPSIFIATLLTAFAALSPAASIRGVVTDASGAKVTGANVTLLSNGKVVDTAVSTADGSFQILTGVEGRFFLVVSATSFRQLETPGFYAGRLDGRRGFLPHYAGQRPRSPAQSEQRYTKLFSE